MAKFTRQFHSHFGNELYYDFYVISMPPANDELIVAEITASPMACPSLNHFPSTVAVSVIAR